jgi:hypothetical protein
METVSYIQASILEQPFRVYRKELSSSFFLYSFNRGKQLQQGGKVCIPSEKKRKKELCLSFWKNQMITLFYSCFAAFNIQCVGIPWTALAEDIWLR